MLNVLVVEDDPNVASILKELVNLHDGFHVVGLADNLQSALTIAKDANVQVALIDIHLARLDSGYQVAAELKPRGISCVFVSGFEPSFPIPELAAAHISKPCTPEAVGAALALASADLYQRGEQPGAGASLAQPVLAGPGDRAAQASE
ncbi:response regulator [Sphingosinicella sp. CPCC 101087]|uniref:response regulator n=1 Tax=Sphingosinicella sp. CPCC 101087 TaxID=2497754 RepID=UPI0013EC1B99|nr:response regulator [Sphingosinicella sp. CPCC 101087]